MSLIAWGWDDGWRRTLVGIGQGAAAVARVTGQERDRWSIQTERGPATARLASASRVDPYPAVGDWAIVEPGPMASDPWSLLGVLPRRSHISRGSAGAGVVEQVLAANVDTIWIVHGLDVPLNPRRLERYLAVAWESGALPEIVLTKADLARGLDATLAALQRIAIGVSVRLVSWADPDAVQTLGAGLVPGQTAALLGPSGVGKSTLVNLLAEAEVARTGAVRTIDRKGRHTTTRRELFPIPGGGLLLDTPGLRELRVWDLGDGLEQTFPEIEALARQCRYRDCRHEAEPGCAVLQAAEQTRLDPERLASFRKLQAEAAFQRRKTDARAKAAAVAEHKLALKTLKQHHPKYRDGA